MKTKKKDNQGAVTTNHLRERANSILRVGLDIAESGNGSESAYAGIANALESMLVTLHFVDAETGGAEGGRKEEPRERDAGNPKAVDVTLDEMLEILKGLSERGGSRKKPGRGHLPF